ncbi:DUF6449 domain-containing protein [Salimicrobium flavidum]|uniref:ABC-2 type transport system permease protein n=1 Tax=Salimicrobium flavidum TaxID=570947 RepID=A0A1N7K8J8_9BACI|nr:DUF6449 domain-containing protein [Salimicrobium flavidum]SIS57916.1 ABC-2 type transport system permease protein [Salimicrobium flavidum]
MPRMTLYKPEILKQILRQAGWISIMYFIALFFIFPFQILRRRWEQVNDAGFYGGGPSPENPLLGYEFGIQYFFTLIVPLLMGIFLFRYLQNKGYSDFLHSLPLKRLQLFLLHIGTGTVLILLPLLLTGTLLGFLLVTGDMEVLYGWGDIGEWIGITTIIAVLIFSVAVFVGMLTGMSLLQGIVAFILLVLPQALVTLVTSNLVFYFDGFTPGYYTSTFSDRYSPVIQLFSDQLGETKKIVLFFYVLAALIFFGIAYMLYKYRPLEMAGQAVSFPKAAPFFQYLIIFCFMMVGGIYFASGVWSSWNWLLFGYIIGSLFGFLVTQMLLEKTWRIFSMRALRNYVIFAAISAIVIFVVQLDPTGYEERVPAFEEVESVYMGDHNYWGNNSATGAENMTQTENILRVMNVHEHLIEEASGDEEGRSLFFEYELQDGEKVARSYVLPAGFNRENYLKQVYESREYKEMNSPIFHLPQEEVVSVEMNGGQGASYEISDRGSIAAFYERMQEDIYSRTYREMTAPHVFGTDVFLHVQGQGMSGEVSQVKVTVNDENTIAWMKEEGIYEQVFLKAENVKELKVVTFSDVPAGDYYEQFRQSVGEGENTETVTDTERIREILTSSIQDGPARKMVGVYYNSPMNTPVDVYGLRE